MEGQRNVRLLNAGEIECRVASVSEKGVSLLLFKDARVDQKILDETYTPFGWKRSHQFMGENLYCTVEVWDESKGQWIGKQDVGTMSDYEKEKGQASDSFKRACFNWGIGRELYTAPFIWVPTEKADIQKKGDRYVCSGRFKVKSISYNDGREISGLEIVDAKGQTVYSMKRAGSRDDAQEQEGSLSKASKVLLMAELNRTGVALQTVLERYGLEDINQMTQETFEKAVRSLKRTKPKETAA